MNKEIFILAIVGILLAVALVQAFQLNGLTEKAKDLGAISVPSPDPQTSQAAPTAAPPPPSTTQMVGGC